MWIDLTLQIPADHPARGALNDTHQELLRSGHVGTHLDVHLGFTIPFDYVVSRGLLADVGAIEGRDVGLEDLDRPSIQLGDFVIFCTHRVDRLGYGTQAYADDGIQLSHAVIDYLIEKRIHFVGIDAVGIRNGPEHTPADKRCEAGGVYVVENLANVPALQGKLLARNVESFIVFAMWIVVEGSGLPCRVIARLPES